jgi:cysteine synthase
MSSERVRERITGTIGDTPLIRLRHLTRGIPGRVVLKREGFNPYGSVKDRIGVAMVEDALEREDVGERYLSNPVFTEADEPALPADVRAALE